MFLNSDLLLLLLLLALHGGGGGGGLKVSVKKNIFCVLCLVSRAIVLCWFVEQLNCAVLFWFSEQVNCVLCESRERDREEAKVAFSVESAPTLFFFCFGGGAVGVD